MRRAARQSYLTILSAFALILQLFAPMLAMANGASPSLICNPAGQISVEMQAGLDDLKTALGIEDENADAEMECETCVASLYFIANAPSQSSTVLRWTNTQPGLQSHKFLIACPRGPPLGSRAPPLNL